ncbi:uncharacterized protein E6C27_scaffold43G00860 [Cucumis melo var. makuwa]|uniref:Uncharacterized protein n=1 Tax=Cucumis melo var. makuwa TaxID=1194695 RepID=A0A5A7U0F2_CUCMM|nr:uncharacterized protein E6C27_scaffold43G00860 [Cucumis melo var. makuwa]
MGIETRQLTLRRNWKESMPPFTNRQRKQNQNGTQDLIEKEAEGLWKSILTRHRDAYTLACKTFRDIFEEKYYLSTYCEVKRDEFLRWKQGSFFVAEYERMIGLEESDVSQLHVVFQTKLAGSQEGGATLILTLSLTGNWVGPNGLRHHSHDSSAAKACFF